MGTSTMEPTSQLTPFGPKSFARQKAEELLKSGSPGDEITRTMAADYIGMSCDRQSKGESVMQRSVDYLLKHGGPYWEWSRHAQCWQCLTNEEMVKALRDRRQKGTRVHKKTLKASEIVDQAALPPESRREYQLIQLQCGMAVFAASTPVRNAMLASTPLEKLTLPSESQLVALMKG